MGSGYKNFNAGDVLTADEVDGYLMRQGVMTFATAAARDSALSGVLDDGMCAYLEDSPKRLTIYDGSTWQTVASAWTTWSPSYGNITVGNGVVSARYSYVGYRTVMAKWTFTMGTTSAIGTAPNLTLPAAPADGHDVYVSGNCTYDDSGSLYDGKLTFGGGSTVSLNVAESAATYLRRAGLTATVPFTFATGDVLRFSTVYEV